MDLEDDYRNGVQPQTLTADTVADVCIVGGGYTWLWTAIQLKQQQPTLDEIEAFCLKYQIDAELRRDGTLFTATNTAQTGYFSPVAASVQPGKLVRSLKRVAEQLGVRIYENTPQGTIYVTWQ